MAVETIDLTINETTESRTSFTKTVKLAKYKTISKMWIEAILSAPSGVLSTGWFIDKILVNGIGPQQNLGQEINLKIFDSRVTGSKKVEVKPGENNIISVGWNAPFGAGVISPHANITVKIRVEGETIAPGLGILPSESIESLNPANITESFDKLADRATIPSIIIFIVLIALVIIGILLLPRILLTKKLIDEVK